jgi:hypothetical protein
VDEVWLEAMPVRAWCVAHGLDPAYVAAILPYLGSDGSPYTMIEYRPPGGDESRTIASWPPPRAWPPGVVERVQRARR